MVEVKVSVNNLEWLWKKIYVSTIGLLLAPFAGIAISIICIISFLPLFPISTNIVSWGAVVHFLVSLYLGYCATFFLYSGYKKVYVYEIAFKEIKFWGKAFFFLLSILLSFGLFYALIFFVAHFIPLSYSDGEDSFFSFFNTLFLVVLPIVLVYIVFPTLRLSPLFVHLQKRLRWVFISDFIFYISIVSFGTLYCSYVPIAYSSIVLMISLLVVFLLDSFLRYVTVYGQKIAQHVIVNIAIWSLFYATCVTLLYLLLFNYFNNFYRLIVIASGFLVIFVRLLGERRFINVDCDGSWEVNNFVA